MIKRLQALVFALIIFLFANTVIADPSPGLSWLQGEPISLFDKGMIEADALMKEVEKEYKENSFFSKSFPLPTVYGKDILEMEMGTAFYSFETNQITLLIQLTNNSKHPISITPDVCSKIIEPIRRVIFSKGKAIIIGLTGKPDIGYERKHAEKLMENLFSHEGYTNRRRPKSLEEELVRLTKILIHITSLFITSFGKVVSTNCSIPLAGGPVSVTE